MGAGPAGLLAAARIKAARPDWQVVVHERSPKDVTYGYGVVFSDVAVRTIRFMTPALGAVLASQVAWQDVEIRAHGLRHRVSGHGYVALSRHRLLAELRAQALDAGVELRYETPVALDELRSRYDLVVAADGARSRTRAALAAELGARVGRGRSRFAWLGTPAAFDAMTFVFEETPDGLAVAHGYPHGDGISTFVVEVPGRDGPAAGTRERAERDLGHWSRVFAEHLGHRPLRAKDLRWEHFPTVRLDRCVHENVVLIGDAAHTAHYSVGSGTRLALEDAFTLGQALGRNDDLAAALAEYERGRLPAARELTAAGERSMRWFEQAPAFLRRPAPQFAVHLLSRASLPSVEKLADDAPELVRRATRVLAGDAPLPPAGVLALPLEAGAARLPGRLLRAAATGGPGPRTAVRTGRIAFTGRDGATAALGLIDMGPCPPDGARAATEAETLATSLAEALAEDARAAGRPPAPAVAVRTPCSGGTGAAGATLARLRVMRRAGLCDLVDLAAPDGGTADPEALLDALELADTVRSSLGVAVLLSGFQARPDQIATHVLAGRVDAWCVPASPPSHHVDDVHTEGD
ncbi:FAD-dependent monooxygenase [Streptomyces caatingaensis]|uniref:FAD-dependent monooxygenase n=1 Tax=Streptomyces caatingaensis TaxID=1678637 RepID=UPI000A4D9D6F|nr:FAD-dependent monooxygenase [Streptomyces caatingaensis]